ncbi:MAG: sugar isomerase [Planctomycetes bacterium]|nr:sugar isomerase [Planctomycetota bacterium]
MAPPRKPLIVKPIFTYTIYAPREQTSWRPWGGCQTQAAVNEEITRIQGEMKKLEETADFPLKFLPLSSVRNAAEVANIPDAKEADAVVVWANDGGNSLHGIRELKKDTVFFIRWRSGPVYLWYEIISPRFLRNHSDHLVMKEFDYDDVVIDELDAVLWRLRALMGLKNTVGSRILTVGGASGWACPEAPNRARDRLKLDIVNISYPELGKLLKAAREDASAMALAKKEADAYLKTEGTTLETDRGFVDRAFLLTRVFRDVMTKAGASNMTINSCMGTIMPISETTACLPLSLLNDGGCMAFCESDFVVVPSGILLGNISGHPTFLNDPCFPHHNEITLAHCTAPRKMDGKTSEKARIVTHFESDYGAAPKVEMRIGQDVTIIVPDFAMERWLGLSAKIIDAPFRPICRSQIDVSFKADTLKVCENMRGFHWMVIYGDYMKEAAYALKKTNIQFESLG